MGSRGTIGLDVQVGLVWAANVMVLICNGIKWVTTMKVLGVKFDLMLGYELWWVPQLSLLSVGCKLLPLIHPSS